MSDDSELDKREQATPYKLEQARKKGSVAKSPELLSAACLTIVTLACFALADPMLRSLGSLQMQLLSAPATDLNSVEQAAQLLRQVFTGSLVVAAPLLFLLVCAAIVANVAQTGPVFTGEPLKPDFSRLNPAKGLKRFFSVRILFELGKNLLKLALLALVLWLALRAMIPSLFELLHVNPARHLQAFAHLGGSLMAKLLAALLLIGVLDLMFVRWEHGRRLRMSHRDIKEEVKHREGSPRVRARMRELRAQLLAKSQSLRKVGDADVVVTNPTRFAVAIRYRHGQDAAPTVIAKGTGDMARRVRELAARHRVPVVHSPRMARALYRHTECEHPVPAEWFPLLARILVWVSAAKTMRSGNAGAPQVSLAPSGGSPAAAQTGGLA